MIDSYRFKQWLSWPLLRAHLCTVAVAVSLNSTWRVPRDAFRFGGLTYALVLTVAMATVALPVTLLQLAVGQLSQQDAVGIWRAVPFFRGVGYLRVIISFLGSVYSMIYVGLTVTYFIYTLSNSIPFWECVDLIVTPDGYENSINASACLNQTFMSPVTGNPEYYLAVALIVLVLWIVFPFLFYNPVKLMKRIFYALGPIIVILCIIIVSCIGDTNNIQSFTNRSDWDYFLEPDIWYHAVVQALLSSQVAGGFLILSGDTIYSSTNVKWTSLALIGINIVASWAGLIFWFSVSTGQKHTSMVAVLIQAYQTAEETYLSVVWPLFIFAMLIFSGIISLLAFLYPVYDRIKRIGGNKWRLISILVSLVGAGMSLTTLVGRLPALTLLEDIAVPLLISIATILEILAFIFIYGWKILIEDIEFLTGGDISKYWVWGCCGAQIVIAPFTIWWLIVILIYNPDWTQAPWHAITLILATVLALVVFVIFAGISVARQVQYDFVGKLKSSFKPSRHWGPRDPITHYYWLARREEAERGNIRRTRYNRRQLGQLSGGSSFLNITVAKDENVVANFKQRSYSDDWLYTVYRRKHLFDTYSEYLSENKTRSRSLGWTSSYKVDSTARRESKLNVISKSVISSEELNVVVNDMNAIS